MNTIEKLTLIRNIFFRAFIIGIIFLVLSAISYIPCKCFLSAFYHDSLGISTVIYQDFWIFFIGAIKTILIFFFLTPTLALHWSILAEKRK